MLKNVKETLNQRIETELAQQLREIPKKIETIIEDAILSILGIRKQSNRYVVDTFGQSNPLNKFILTKVDLALEEHVGKIIQTKLEQILKGKSLENSIKNIINNNITYRFENRVRDGLTTLYEDLANKYIKKLQTELTGMLENLADINTDLADPDSLQGKLGELLLEEQARLLAEKK